VLSVANLKLADLEKEERTRLENHQQFGSAKATFSDLLVEYRTGPEANHSIKPRTRAYYNERIEAMLKNGSALRQFDVRKTETGGLRTMGGERSSLKFLPIFTLLTLRWQERN
jgi:hypothetical protein